MWTIAYEKANLVSRHRGTLPVILSGPHDGKEAPPGVPKRTGSNPDCPPFKTTRDLHTREITQGIAQRLLDVFGEAPYVVIAEFHRQYIDANRPSDCGFEVPTAQPFYDEYHNTLRSFVNEIRAGNGGLGLLFDIHGTRVIEEDPADLYLGTDNGKTVQRLQEIDRHVLWRRRSLRGWLGPEAAGYVVSPLKPGIPETPAVDGGHTIRTYGSSHTDGVDAIQIEIASSLRDHKDKRTALIEHLGRAIGNLVDRYANAHTLAAFQKVNFLSGDLEQLVTGQVQRRSENNDTLLQLGGGRQNRGRVEIRNDSGGTVNVAASRRPGVAVLYSENGSGYHVWVDNLGRLRISSSETEADNQVGIIVGTQTIMRRRRFHRLKRRR
jgi:N-formylglutamate amidohydrolase